MAVQLGAGDLDRRLQFLRGQDVDNGFQAGAGVVDDGFQSGTAAVQGGAADPVGGMVPHGAPVWAKRMDVSDGERSAAAGIMAGLSVRFILRRSPFVDGLTNADQIQTDGDVFNILGKKEVNAQRRAYVEISARLIGPAA